MNSRFETLSLKDKQVALLSEIQALLGGASPPRRAAPRPPATSPRFRRRKLSLKRRTVIEETTERPRKQPTDHKFTETSDERILGWLKAKEKEMKRVRREKAREERAAKRQEKQTVKAKEERRETASKKYAEWSIRKIRTGRKIEGAGPEKVTNERAAKGEIAYKKWVARKERERISLKIKPEVVKNEPEDKLEERRKKYEAWVQRKESEMKDKARRKKIEDQELKKEEEEAKRRTAEEKAKRTSYDDWLARKQGEIRKERREERETMKIRVDTGIQRERSKGRRLRNDKGGDLNRVLGGYVKTLIVEKNMGVRPEPQGCDGDEKEKTLDADDVTSRNSMSSLV